MASQQAERQRGVEPPAKEARRLRVLVVSDLYPPVYQGGYELACRDVAGGLARRGHEIHVLTSRHQAAKAEPSPREERVLRFREQQVSTLLRREWSDNRLTRAVVERVRPDVISVWNMGGLTKSILYSLQASGAPLTYYVHDDWLARQLVHDRWLCLWKPETSSGLERLVKQTLSLPAIRRLAARVAPTGGPLDLSQLVFVSYYIRRDAVRAGLCPPDAPVIHAGIDTARFPVVPSHRRPGPLRLLFAGRLVSEKGVGTAIEGLATVLRRRPGSCRLTLAGAPREAADERALRSLIDRLGVAADVDVVGRVERDAMPAVYGRHDSLLFPSVGPEGGVPISIMEAMASGLVVVGSLTGGTGELLSDGRTGLTFPIGDATALSHCVERLMDDPALWRRLSEAGRTAVVEGFTIERVVDEFEAFLAAAAARTR
jgi:glycosyltransferase involved in cell wall biosynthesis